MKRSIDPDFAFDRARFSEILKQATGARSNVEFAREAELSVSYLSRYINQKVDMAPTLGTLKKIAKVGGVLWHTRIGLCQDKSDN